MRAGHGWRLATALFIAPVVGCYQSHARTDPSIDAGSVADSSTAVDARAGGELLDLAVGYGHTCVLRVDGRVLCWGEGSDPPATPSWVEGLPPIAELAAGNAFTCARARQDGVVYCWGANTPGHPFTPIPERVPASSGATAIAAGQHFACLVDASGAVRCWGDNDRGQLGDGTLDSRPELGQPVVDLPSVVDIGAGAFQACAIDERRGLHCWGNLPFARPTPMPEAVIGADAVRQVAIGGPYCVVRDEGTAACWSLNFLGEVGDGTYESRGRPTQVLGLRDVTHVAAGTFSACAIHDEGRVSCWGGNEDGQLGVSDRDRSAEPLPVAGLDDAIALGVGWFHACALRAEGGVWCWGSNPHGQLGDRPESAQAAGPVPGLE